MERPAASIEVAIQRTQREVKARGILRLSEIFGRLFTRDELISALEHASYNIENASIYLQDHLPGQSTSKLVPDPLPSFSSTLFDNLFMQPYHKDSSENAENAEIIQVDCPVTGKIALEFSLSPQYINCVIPVFYVSDEILKEIFSFLSAADRGKLAHVCKTMKKIEEKTDYLYKRDCLALWIQPARPEICVFSHPFDSTSVLWGEGYPKGYQEGKEYLKAFKSWRNMWIKRPKIRIGGIYVSRVSYFRQGQVNMDNLPSYHKVVFYRFLRFHDDFSVCCLNTTKKPREVVRLVDKGYEGCRVGEWARHHSHLRVHLLAKNEVFTYDLEIRSSQGSLFDLLKLEKVQSRSVSDLQYYEMNINNEAWPKYFKYYPLRF